MNQKVYLLHAKATTEKNHELSVILSNKRAQNLPCTKKPCQPLCTCMPVCVQCTCVHYQSFQRIHLLALCDVVTLLSSKVDSETLARGKLIKNSIFVELLNFPKCQKPWSNAEFFCFLFSSVRLSLRRLNEKQYKKEQKKPFSACSLK